MVWEHRSSGRVLAWYAWGFVLNPECCKKKKVFGSVRPPLAWPLPGTHALIGALCFQVTVFEKLCQGYRGNNQRPENTWNTVPWSEGSGHTDCFLCPSSRVFLNFLVYVQGTEILWDSIWEKQEATLHLQIHSVSAEYLSVQEEIESSQLIMKKYQGRLSCSIETWT
jgi:hypothetical protein